MSTPDADDIVKAIAETTLGPNYKTWTRACGTVVYGSTDAYDAWLESIGEKTPKPLEVIETKPGKCDCGSESAGSSRHSTWCSAYEK